MGTEFFLKGFFCALISLILAALVFSRNDREMGRAAEEYGDDRQRYLPYLPAMLLPITFLLLGIAAVWELGARRAVPQLMGTFLGIFLHMSVYDMLLLLFLPFLRKRISARTCALLWLIPTYLYYTLMSFMEVPEPLWVIALPERMVWALFGIWFVGFSIVMIWKLASHLAFRRSVLKEAAPVTDAGVLELLKREAKTANFKKPDFRLVRSARVSTPLSIGLFHRTVRIVLPERAFSEGEYRLIFRHELVHIGREDAWSKFFLAFCVAACWFNPFMWIAGRKSAEDLELSCDETVLLDGDLSMRRQYAELLLKAAGDDRGFTTCLSSAASTMRYRLKAVIGDGEGNGGRNRKHSGALTVALLFFGMSMSCGYVALAYGESTGKEKIFQNPWPAAEDLYRISVEGGEYDPKADLVDAEAVTEYLMNLPMQEITGNYSYEKDGKCMEFEFYSTGLSSSQTAAPAEDGLAADAGSQTASGDKPDGESRADSEVQSVSEIRADDESAFSHTGFLLVRLYESFVTVSSLHGERGVYYLPEGVDWDYLYSLCPRLPALEVRLFDEGDPYGDIVHPLITGLVCKSEGEERILKALDRRRTDSGIYSYRPIGKKAQLSFSMEPVSDVEVLVSSWDWKNNESVAPSRQEKDGVWTFPLSDDFAHYTIRVTFRDENGTDYITEFYFNIGSSAEDLS